MYIKLGGGGSLGLNGSLWFYTSIFRTFKDRKRILITGGAGFVGSHLVDKLMLDGHEVISFFKDRGRVSFLLEPSTNQP